MNIFYEYQNVKQIHLDPHYRIYRAINRLDRTSVIIKTINNKSFESQTSAWLKNEYQILQNLNLTGIVKPYSLEQDRNSYTLILEDFGGEYLDCLLKTRKLSQEDFFNIALQLAQILHELHQNQIVHHNLQPQSIVIDPETLEVKITDFRIATKIVSENLSSPQLEAVNIAYISPEQTGRMNIPLDYRTDFYSLGVVFYHILTGKLPCDTKSDL